MYPPIKHPADGEKCNATLTRTRLRRSAQLFSILSLFAMAATAMGQAPDFSWATKGGGPQNDFGRGITVDGSGNVIVTGSFVDASVTFEDTTLPGSASYPSAYIAKFGNHGSLAWVKTVVVANGYPAYGNSVAAGNSGDVFMTGMQANGGQYQVFTAKYNAAGDLMWSRQGGGLILSRVQDETNQNMEPKPG